MGDRVSLSELGRRLGRAKSGLHKAAARGQITKGPDGLFDVDEARAQLTANTEPAQQKGVFSSVHGPANGQRTTNVPPDIEARAEAEAQLATTRVREILRAEGVIVEGELTFTQARTAEKIVQTWQRDQAYAKEQGLLIKADEAGRRWADEMVKLRARLLAIPGECALVLPHLSKFDVSEIDRVVRDTMMAAAGDDAAG